MVDGKCINIFASETCPLGNTNMQYPSVNKLVGDLQVTRMGITTQTMGCRKKNMGFGNAYYGFSNPKYGFCNVNYGFEKKNMGF